MAILWKFFSSNCLKPKLVQKEKEFLKRTKAVALTKYDVSQATESQSQWKCHEVHSLVSENVQMQFISEISVLNHNIMI